MSITLVIAIVGLIVAFIVLVVIVRILLSSGKGDSVPGTSRKELEMKWMQIEQLANRGDEMSSKLALMEADKFFDHMLKTLMFSGDTMGERMKVAAYKFPKIRDAWPAHILRNKMVHETSFSLRPDSARRAIGQFKAALKQMNVL